LPKRKIGAPVVISHKIEPIFIFSRPYPWKCGKSTPQLSLAHRLTQNLTRN
jgi:hypothetical protein